MAAHLDGILKWTLSSIAVNIECGTSRDWKLFLIVLHRNVDQLPTFPEDAPLVVKNLVFAMLEPDPRCRISATMAANICQLLLWMPSKWIGKRYPGKQELLQWLLTMTTKVLYESRFSNSSAALHEYHLIATFQSRFQLRELVKCVDWIHDNC